MFNIAPPIVISFCSSWEIEEFVNSVPVFHIGRVSAVPEPDTVPVVGCAQELTYGEAPPVTVKTRFSVVGSLGSCNS